MKKITLFLFGILVFLHARAQEDKATMEDKSGSYIEVMRSVLSTEKKAAIADIMSLTKEESDAFWSLYNQLQKDLYDVNTTKFNLIKDFGDNFESMTDEKAAEINSKYIAMDIKEDQVYKAYMPKFQKIIGGKKTLRYFQAENKIRVLVEYQLAANIPLLD